MPIVFVLGLLTLLGAYLLFTGYVDAWGAIRETWGTGLAGGLGCFPPIQWLWAVQFPSQAAGPLLSQLLGVLLLAPAGGAFWFWYQLCNGNFKIG